MPTRGKVPYRILGSDVVCKVAGVTFDGRQANLREMSEGDAILIIPKPHPKHKEAVAVYSKVSNRDIGWLPKNLANIVTENFNNNGNPPNVTGSVLEITGGFSHKSYVGMIIGFTMPSGRIE